MAFITKPEVEKKNVQRVILKALYVYNTYMYYCTINRCNK